MPDLEEINPYPEDEPKLRQVWEDGYRAAKRGKRAESIADHRDEIQKAWRDGYQTALDEDKKASTRSLQLHAKRKQPMPGLREAFLRGWRACLKGNPRPEESLFEGGKRAEAWTKDYEEAGCR